MGKNVRHLSVSKSLNFICLLFCFLSMVVSCRKQEVVIIPITDKSNSIVDEFLHLPLGTDSVLVRVTNQLRKRDRILPFIEKLAHSVGSPQWSFAEMTIASRINNSRAVSMNSSTVQKKLESISASNDSIVLIPFISQGMKKVDAILAISLTDTFSVSLVRDRDFAIFGYSQNSDRPSAKAVALRFMLFENKIFGFQKFRIKDRELALSLSGGLDTIGIFNIQIDDNTGSISNKIKSNLTMAVTTCTGGTWVPDPNVYWDTYSSPHPPKLVGGECTTTWLEFSDPATSGQDPDFSSTTYSSGGSSGVTGQTSLYAEADRIPDSWEAVDENGFYLARQDVLQALLDEEPFNIIPCDQLKLMPLDDNGPNGFGLMFKRVAQVEVSTEIRARLDSIAAVAPTNILSPFKVQTISNAYGGVVNCDYFQVHIDVLPSGYTAETLLELFRKQTNSFIDPAIGNSFSPYTDGSFTDAARYYSPFEESVGALVHLDLLNDGSVVESNYYRTNSPFKCRFTYSTISSPLDYNHPVSGNREFGIFANPSGNGYTFYTMGVDRTTDFFITAGNWISFDAGFAAADALWKSVQSKMENFVNTNGGQAYKVAPVIARPRWNHVGRYLRGEITFTLLKRLLGC